MPKATLASPANWKGYPALWNRRQAVRVTRQTSQPIARGSGLRTNEVRTGSAEGGLKIFRYRICDNPSGARGFGGSPLYSSRTKIGVASIVCHNPETRTV